MEEFLRSFYVLEQTFNDEQRKQQARKRCRSSSKNLSSSLNSSRHVVWTENDRKAYKLLRVGIPLNRRDEADRLYDEKKLREVYFYIFCHCDPHLERNALVPKYEAAYFFVDSGEYVRVKKCHLKSAYQLLGRSIHANIWTVDADGLPYWVDRHAFSKKKQQRSKRKYEASKNGTM